MSSEKNIVVIGATSAIAEQCARLWIGRKPSKLTLVGRNIAKTRNIADDLKVRSPNVVIEVLTTDFVDPKAVQALTDTIASKGPLDIVLIAHGSLPEQSVCQRDLGACREALTVNGISPALFAEAFAGALDRQGHGTLAVIGSVAGDRGRKSNYVYGAAKGLVTRYVQGLQHRFAGSAVKIVLIKPGPTDTPMTAELKRQGARLAAVEAVAEA
ncbi:MAG: SDR family NAD(P)-dependent oxidoreductase, partial [Gammaproteobacteria bacterium]